MAQSFIRGSTQILAASITADRFAASLALPTAQLAEGALFIKSNGTVAMAAALAMGNNLISNLADAVSAQDAVNLRTLQSFVNGFGASKRARTISTANVVVTGLQNFDGVTGVAGDIVWLNAQTVTSQNGFWTMAAGAWTRPALWAAASTQKSFLLFIEEGTTFHDTKWTVAADAIVVDTGTASAVQDTSGLSYTAGNGILLTGSVFSAKLGFGLNFDGTNQVQVLANGASLNVTASGVKITDGTPGQLMLANASNAATFTTLSGDVTLTSAGIATVNNTAGTGFIKYANIVSNETVGGTPNSVLTAFTLAFTPQVGSLELVLNGLVLEPGAGNDYTISGTAITMLFAPTTGDKLRAYYFK